LQADWLVKSYSSYHCGLRGMWQVRPSVPPDSNGKTSVKVPADAGHDVISLRGDVISSRSQTPVQSVTTRRRLNQTVMLGRRISTLLPVTVCSASVVDPAYSSFLPVKNIVTAKSNFNSQCIKAFGTKAGRGSLWRPSPEPPGWK